MRQPDSQRKFKASLNDHRKDSSFKGRGIMHKSVFPLTETRSSVTVVWTKAVALDYRPVSRHTDAETNTYIIDHVTPRGSRAGNRCVRNRPKRRRLQGSVQRERWVWSFGGSRSLRECMPHVPRLRHFRSPHKVCTTDVRGRGCGQIRMGPPFLLLQIYQEWTFLPLPLSSWDKWWTLLNLPGSCR